MPYVNGVYVPKTETITRNVEEFLGPLDPGFDYHSVAREAAERMSPKPDVDALVAKWRHTMSVAMAKNIQDEVRPQVTDDGGSPRFGWYDVLHVGMAATWPYWTPRPTVIVASQFGMKWMDFTSITEVRLK